MVFRWNIARREQLGSLVEGQSGRNAATAAAQHAAPRAPNWEPPFDMLLEELRRCCARVLAMAGDSRLVFIGRSPESFYDYLTGAFTGTSWSTRLTLLNVSLRACPAEWAELDSAAREGIAEQFRSINLDPARVARSPRPIALIDLICEGGTFGSLTDLLSSWAAAEQVSQRAVWRRLRIVGITQWCEPTTAPSPWRRLDWASRFRPQSLKGVSIPGWFWTYLGDDQKKVSRSNPPSRWGDSEMALPPREPERNEALRLARALYDAGRSRAECDALAAEVSRQPAMQHPWCRALTAELRAAGRPRQIERSFASKHRIRSRRRAVQPSTRR
jgi:hypothetical protein